VLLRLAVRNHARHRRRTILAGMVFFLATFALLVNVGEPRLMSRDEMMEGFQWIRRQVERRTDLRQNPRVAQFRRLVMEFMTAGRLHTYISKRV
jgi:hypothetical protein